MDNWKRCNRCGNALIGNEQRSDTCNRCLDLGYGGMSDEEYGALDLATHERTGDRTMARHMTSEERHLWQAEQNRTHGLHCECPGCTDGIWTGLGGEYVIRMPDDHLIPCGGLTMDEVRTAATFYARKPCAVDICKVTDGHRWYEARSLRLIETVSPHLA